MGVQAMHAKSDSDATTISAAASPPRPLYFVQSPSHHDKMSYNGNSSPFASPPPHYYNVQHSRESSTSRFSASFMLKSGSRSGGAWRRLYARGEKGEGFEEEEEGDDVAEEEEDLRRFYVGCFVVCFVALFTVFSLILWAAATTYPPKIYVQGMVFHDFNDQAAIDNTGVPTDMLDLNSTVKIFYRNPATFFGVHVSSTPFELHYYKFRIATGHMKKFYQSRKSQRHIVTSISAKQEPLYGNIPVIFGQKNHPERVHFPLNLTFVIRSQAYVLGSLVKPIFYRKIRCEFIFRRKLLGKPLKNFADTCTYDE